MAEEAPLSEQAVRQPNQRSVVPEDLYFNRFLPTWSNPNSFNAAFWRAAVKQQPLALLARDTVIAHALGWDWKIVPREGDKLQELKATIKYYTRLIEQGVDGFDYAKHVDGLLQDVLDIPFGGATEIGRAGDAPSGRVQWVVPLDGGTLYPTGDHDIPVAQIYYGGGSTISPILFPYYAVSRAYISPRKELLRSGWGMAPPEKVWFALDLLARGDYYYRNLLLDTPPAGILDLGDMERDSAVEWVKAYQTMLIAGEGATSGFKIPVLYEHNNPVNFIKFGAVPNDLMFDRMMIKYASIVAASYGVTLSDIGMSGGGGAGSGGETLAGSIRDERRTRRTGDARTKKTLKAYFDYWLPNTLEFLIIDPDEESLLSRSRSMLAYGTAFGLMIDKNIFSAPEARRQALQDGIFTIDLPEEIPPDEIVQPPTPQQPGQVPGKSGKTGLTRPVAPSSGGHGDVKLSSVSMPNPDPSYLIRSVRDIGNSARLILSEMYAASDPDGYYVVNESINSSVFGSDGFGLVKLAMQSTKLDWINFKVDGKFQEEAEKYFTDDFSMIAKSEFEVGHRGTLELTKDELKELKSRTHSIKPQDFAYSLSSDARRFFVQMCITTLSEVLLANESIDLEQDEVYDNAISTTQSKLAGMFDPAMEAISSVKIQQLAN